MSTYEKLEDLRKQIDERLNNSRDVDKVLSLSEAFNDLLNQYYYENQCAR